MKSIIILLSLLCSYSYIFAQGVEFTKGSFQEILEKSRIENKPVFIDVYTTWCGPCKHVAQNIFPNEKIGSYYNEHFINYQLDAEKGEGPELSKKYKITGYPTFLYLDSTGMVLSRFAGAKDIETFLQEAKQLSGYARYGGKDKMIELFRMGKLDTEALFDLYNFSTKDVKPYVLNAYMKSLPDDILFDEVSKKYVEEMSVYDSVLMDRLVKGIETRCGYKPEYDFSVVFPIQWSVTKFFGESIESANEKEFNELLALKNHFYKYQDRIKPDNDIDLMWGRGLFFVSESMVKLSYMVKHENDDYEFIKLMDSYMPFVMKQVNMDTILTEKNKYLQAMEMEESFRDFFQDDFLTQYDMASNLFVDCISYYWRLSPSDKETKLKCKGWCMYVYSLNNYNSIVSQRLASLLVRIGYRDDALKLIDSSIDAQNKLGKGCEKNIWKLNRVRNDIVNKK